MANRYQGNSEGLRAREERKKDDISVDYVQRSRDLRDRGLSSEEYERERNNLRQERDNNLKELNDKHRKTEEIMESREPGSDYGDWETDRNSPESEDNSNEANQNQASSSSRNQESTSTSANQESSSTSATGSRFKQDSSDVMPDNEPMDFDDPTG